MRKILLCIAITFAMGASAGAEPAAQPDGVKPGQTTAAPTERVTSPGVANASGAPGKTTGAERQAKAAVDVDDKKKGLIFFFDHGYTVGELLTLAFAAILMIVGLLQVWLVFVTSRDTHKAADAAKASADAATKALTLLERPYVTVRVVSAAQLMQNPSVISVEIKNVGRAPATIARMEIDVSAHPGRPAPLAKALDRSVISDIIPPDGTVHFDHVVNFTAHVHQQIVNGGLQLYFRLLIPYSFSDTVYTTAVCQRYDPKTGLFGIEGGVEHNFMR